MCAWHKSKSTSHHLRAKSSDRLIPVKMSGRTYSVRYIGIDTPERNQRGYQEANEVNSELVMGKTVVLEKDVSEVDRYGRLLRYVWVDGYMVNAILVATGFAESARYLPDTQYTTDFVILESYARDRVLGLWKYQGFGR